MHRYCDAQAKLQRIEDAKKFEQMAADAANAQHAEFMKQLKSQLATSFRSGVDAGSKKEQARFLDMLQRKVSASAAEASRAVRQELGHELNRVRSETKVLRAEKTKCVCWLPSRRVWILFCCLSWDIVLPLQAVNLQRVFPAVDFFLCFCLQTY